MQSNIRRIFSSRYTTWSDNRRGFQFAKNVTDNMHFLYVLMKKAGAPAGSVYAFRAVRDRGRFPP